MLYWVIGSIVFATILGILVDRILIRESPGKRVQGKDLLGERRGHQRGHRISHWQEFERPL